MLRKGLGGASESGESSFDEAVKLTPDHPAKRFDHYELVTGEDGKPVESSLHLKSCFQPTSVHMPTHLLSDADYHLL